MEQVQLLVQQEQERTGFQEQQDAWKLKYEQLQQDFAKAAQEWSSREQLLLKLLRDREKPQVYIDIEERFNVSGPEPKVTHLSDQVTQIELGISADNFYHGIVKLTVETFPTVEEVLNYPSQTVEETPEVDKHEVQEHQETSETTEVISPEPEEPTTQAEGEGTKAEREDGSTSPKLTGGEDIGLSNVPQEIESAENSTMAEPVATPVSVETQAGDVHLNSACTHTQKRKRKNRKSKSKKCDKQTEESPEELQDVTTEEGTKDIANDIAVAQKKEVSLDSVGQIEIANPENVQKTSTVEVNEVQAEEPATLSEDGTKDDPDDGSTSSEQTREELTGSGDATVLDLNSITDENEDILDCVGEPSQATTTKFEDVQKTLQVEMNEVQALSEDTSIISAKTEEPVLHTEDVPEDWFTTSVYTEEESVSVPQQNKLSPTQTESEDVPEDWFSSSVCTEEAPASVPQQAELSSTLTEAETSPDMVFPSEEVTLDTAVPSTTTNISRKAKRNKKKNNVKRYYNDGQSEEDYDTFCDYDDLYLRKGNAKAKSVQSESRGWRFEANGRKKGHKMKY